MTRQDVTFLEYEEIELIKQSDKSAVHLVREMYEGRFCVRKILKGEQSVYQMLREHPHPFLPKLYDVMIADGETTVIEEYIDGQTLGIVRLSRKQFRDVAGDLCSVLEFLHGIGIIHRDIKPSNIILTADGHIRLIDFDAARMPKDDMEQDTRLLGTRGYAPPEQYGFSQTDARTDIYSMGVTLGQVLGNCSFPMRRYKRIIKKCKNLNPDKRYQSVRQVRKAFFHGKQTAVCIIAFALLAAMSVHTLRTELNDAPYRGTRIGFNTDNDRFDIDRAYGYLGRNVEDVMDERGTPVDYSEGGGVNWCSYLGMEFLFDADREIYMVILDTVDTTYDGKLLNRDRDWIVANLGEPSNEGWGLPPNNGWGESDIYYIFYENFDSGRNLMFYLKSPGERAYAVAIS